MSQIHSVTHGTFSSFGHISVVSGSIWTVLPPRIWRKSHFCWFYGTFLCLHLEVKHYNLNLSQNLKNISKEVKVVPVLKSFIVLRFRLLGRLETKYEDTMTEYYLAFTSMCKRVAGLPLTEEEGKTHQNLS